ncbi:hypothetical protein GOBAR_AA25270 [Gossypium barbadense]|uniref:Uncharacterized protein n=1 Tax=Gossypium barbadense TaxID=3634 RepID=A0A2P5WWF6_GOSBA|nr:hypothetical protein GOBAR_AA25270 [Gossypium barbadense]
MENGQISRPCPNAVGNPDYRPWEHMTNTRGKKSAVLASKKRKGSGATSSSATTEFRLNSLVRQLSVPEFSVALGLYTDEFMEADDFPHLHRQIHYSPSSCWDSLSPIAGAYDPSRSKASALSPALRYIHALLAYTLTRLTFWAAEHIAAILITHTHRSDVPTRHLSFKRFSRLVLLRNIQTILWGKIIHDCHVLLDHDHSYHDTNHHDNLFIWHYDCGTQPLPPSEYPAPPSPLSSYVIVH